MSYLLVAEDNPTEQLILRAVLSKAGYSVFIASGGQEALELLSQLAFDLAVIDIQMPELDGLEVIRRFRSSDTAYACGTPLLAVSADTSASVEAEAREAGATAWMVKPLAADALRDVVARLIADEPLGGRAIHDHVESHPCHTLNKALLDRLRANVSDARFVATLAERFLHDASANMVSLRDAHAGKQWTELRELAHALQGSAGSVGAELLQARAHRLCHADDASLRDHGRELIEEMDVERVRLRRRLLAYVATA